MHKICVAVIGAGGKMGTRTSKNLVKHSDKYQVMLVENAPKGIESIHGRGLEVTPIEEAIEAAQVVIFAVPDTLIQKLSAIYVPMLKPGTGFLILDPAAAVAKELSLRDDIPAIPPISWIRIPRKPGRTVLAETGESRILS